MRIFFLSTALLACMQLSAQTGRDATASAPQEGPEVIITGHEAKGPADSAVVAAAVEHYYQTRIEGFQQSGLPRFIITGREHKFLLGIGGFVNFRASYDFNGSIDNRDFVTYDIPVPASPATRDRFGMDATASRLFFKAIANSEALGQVVSYIETDFRGDPEGATMRLRYAYIQVRGLLFGRNVTTFCDLTAAPTTVDTEGPNAYTFSFNDMVRYTFQHGRWSAAVAVEAPSASGAWSGEVEYMTQRVPDVPMYVQYRWGTEGKHSHARLSTILRGMQFYNAATGEAYDRAGWGLQLSGSVRLPAGLRAYAQGVYGHGIARYLQDIAGVGMDLVPDPAHEGLMTALPMGGGFAALQYTWSQKLSLSAGYSQVAVARPDGLPRDDRYRDGKYAFANLFVSVGSSCTLGLEYIDGQRRNMDDGHAHAHRIQGMIQYNF